MTEALKATAPCCDTPDLAFEDRERGSGRDCEKLSRCFCRSCGCSTEFHRASGFNVEVAQSARASAAFFWPHRVEELRKAA